MHRFFWYVRPTSNKIAVIFQFRAVTAYLFSTNAKLERWHSIILGKFEFLRRLAFPTCLDFYCFLLCKADKAHSCPQSDMATPTLCVTATLPCYHSWADQCSWNFTYGFARKANPVILTKQCMGSTHSVLKKYNLLGQLLHCGVGRWDREKIP